MSKRTQQGITKVHKTLRIEESMASIDSVRSMMAAIIKLHLGGQSERLTAVPGLSIHGVDYPVPATSYVYEPCFAMIARGAKRVSLGDETYVYDESHFLLTAVGLPTVVQVLNATSEAPYLSIKLDLDLDLARELIADVDETGPLDTSAVSGMAIGPVDTKIALAALRLVELLNSPEDIPILCRSIQRELLYRVLRSSAGSRLRRVVLEGSNIHRVDAAIRYIRQNFKSSIRIKQLVEVAGMAESTLNRHFRDVTAMSPLQYQKKLRLHEARHLMLSKHLDAAAAAFMVGYESATQFNREYRRLFGAPPKSDIAQLLVGSQLTTKN